MAPTTQQLRTGYFSLGHFSALICADMQTKLNQAKPTLKKKALTGQLNTYAWTQESKSLIRAIEHMVFHCTYMNSFARTFFKAIVDTFKIINVNILIYHFANHLVWKVTNDRNTPGKTRVHVRAFVQFQ